MYTVVSASALLLLALALALLGARTVRRRTSSPTERRGKDVAVGAAFTLCGVGALFIWLGTMFQLLPRLAAAPVGPAVVALTVGVWSASLIAGWRLRINDVVEGRLHLAALALAVVWWTALDGAINAADLLYLLGVAFWVTTVATLSRRSS